MYRHEIFVYNFLTNSNILFYLRHHHTSLTFHKIRVCTVNNSIPILHDSVNGVIYIVQTNIIGLGQLDLPVMLRVIPLQPVDMKILYKHVKGK